MQKHFLLFASLILSMAAASHAAPAYVWIEGEAPAAVSPAAVKPDITDVGTPQYLSGGKWLHVSIGHDDVAKTAPDGVTVSYKFTAPQDASYEVWDRAGYQASRSAFDWRLDGGDWHSVPPGAPFVQLQQLQTWNDVSWMHLGDQHLGAGDHTLEFRVSPKGADGKPQDIVFALDAACLSAGSFQPNDQYKPGDVSWETDADRAAAKKTFDVTASAGSAQTATPLVGDWQMARDEEMAIHDADGPMSSVPAPETLAWKATPVPGNVFQNHPEWTYAHRYLLRTRLNVPASLAGRSFVLHCPAISMTATAFVNGQPCGYDDTPFASWDCDITKALKPGQVNEIVLSVKDWYYALPDYGAQEGGHLKYTPTDWVTKFGPASFTYPVWNHPESGLLMTPSLIVGGPVYTSDVFCRPSVQNKALTLDITLTNPTGQDRTISVGNSVAPLSGGPAEKTFAAQDVTVPAGGTKTVTLTEAWTDPKIWWPDSPNQYLVTTTLSEGGQPVDSRTTKFGFREWAWDGDNFRLNGIPWHGRADNATYAPTTDAWLAAYHKHGQTMIRYWGEPESRDADLDWYDAHGINVRRTDIFDGEAAAYHLDTPGLWDHYRQQLAAWIKGQRNHPSIFVWSVENEITFINGHVTGQDQLTTDQHHKTAPVVSAADPTRPFMVDGGNALLDQSFPVYGGHYMEPPFASLPAGAYDDRAAFAHRQVWPVTQEKPILLGESFFANGNEPGDFATVGGEAPFLGKAEAAPAIDLTGKMLSEGYRWDDVNFHFWMAPSSDLYYNAWQPVAVLCRQWDWTFGAGQTVLRTLKVFNDTRDSAPITLKTVLSVGGHTFAGMSKTLAVPTGGNVVVPVTLTMPATSKRLSGAWTLTLIRGGTQVFKDVKPLSVLPRARLSLSALPFAKPSRVCPTPARLAVYDPAGDVRAFLRSQGVAFAPITSLTWLPGNAKALLIGPDALTPSQSASSALAAYATTGRTVIVLEQKNPLRFQALPGQMEATGDAGDVAFMEDPSDPLFRGLQQSDFFTWGPDGTVYAAAYGKPTSGGRSLVQCSSRLQDSALAEMTPGKGLMILSQLVVGHKITSNAVAQHLLLNMIAEGLAYKQIFRPVAVAAASNPPLVKTLDATGLQYSKAAGALAALAHPGGIAVVDATPGNLAPLAASPARVAAFTRAGGWIVLNNLTPEGLAAYDKLVGVNHILRRFGQNATNTSLAGSKHIEKVTLAPQRSPLLAGLSASNIVLGSGQQIFGYAAGQYPDENGYSYIVDTGDVAPFATSSWGSYGNIVNGFTQADGFWPLIVNFPAPTDGRPFPVPITLPRPETLARFSYAQDLNYQATSQISLVFDDGSKQTFDVKPTGDVQTFDLTPKTTRTVTLELDKWNTNPSGKTLLGLDNLWLYARRPASEAAQVKPMLNIGALVEYPKGPGGIVLCNVLFQEREANPENAGKKQAILATILKNLQAPFTGGKSIIAGAANLAYAPLNIGPKANQYKNDQGWFGDKQFTFADLPGGTQRYAGVPYNVYNFTTSPVPTVIMLGGNGIPGNLPDHVDGIPVGRKADALFFLQAARIDGRRNADDLRNNRQFEIADYVVHYADGQTAKVPIYAEVSVDDYRQDTPAPIPGAQIAWVKPYAGTNSSAVAYSMQWNNPRPDVAIDSLNLVAGPNRDRGVPALLALTAATAH